MFSKNSSSPLTDNESLLSSQHNFLQQSSLLTVLPPELKHTEVKITEQKTLSPIIKPALAKLDPEGGIHINIAISPDELTLGRLIGKGGFGAVYAGVYNGKPVAIKQLGAHLTEEAVKELKREAEIMVQLMFKSNHIVSIKGICLVSPYSLVMELMPKGSLYDVLHSSQTLPWAIRYQIALDAAWGLKDLHEYKILHRDLKSLNILLDDRLRAKLADFGLAKVKNESSSQSSAAKGTVLWMAPELFDDEPKMTSASDIYSFGMVLWELLTRLIPYAKASHPMVAARWIEKGKKEEIPNDCPTKFKTIIEWCWESIPTKRPSAGQLVESLKPLANPIEVSLVEPLKSTIINNKGVRIQLELKEKPVPCEPLPKPAELKLGLPAQPLLSQSQYTLTAAPELKKIKIPSTKLTAPSTVKHSHRLMPAPKAPLSAAELKLQNELIVACEQGQVKTVLDLLKQGANPDATTTGKKPLGAAIWGMNSDIVNELINKMDGSSPMTWEECEKHNLEVYGEIFIMPKLVPQKFGDWLAFLQKIEQSSFVRDLYLKELKLHWHNDVMSTWDTLISYVKSWSSLERIGASLSKAILLSQKAIQSSLVEQIIKKCCRQPPLHLLEI